MYPLMLSVAACLCLAFAGTGFAKTKHSAPKAAAVAAKKAAAAKPAAAKASLSPSAKRPAAKPSAQSQVRAARYGGFTMAPPPPPPSLDLTSPRTLSLVNVNTDEALIVTYWSDGAYRRDALDKLNHFLRDSREGAETEMDPLLFDVLWHTQIMRLQRRRRGPLGLSFTHHQRLAGERQPRRGQRQPAHEWQRDGHPLPRRAGVQGPPGRAFARHGRRRLLSALGLRPSRYRPGPLLVGALRGRNDGRQVRVMLRIQA